MVAELYGKVTGCARGKGGSMHLIDPSANVMGASAVVGTNIPLGVGAGLTAVAMGKQQVSVVFLGDGAIEEGVFHESLNFAGLRNLPVLFVCENNNYAIHTPRKQRQADTPIYERCRSYGIESAVIEDGDVFKIYERTCDYVNRMRNGEGPFFLQCDIYRWKEHVGPGEDFTTGYRDQAEIQEWIDRDPVVVTGTMLAANVRAAINESVEGQVTAAFEFAETSPFPNDEELLQHLYSV
jgi:TPP-dependent pyruvate/acetoin dehydrogenase alpha subunit